MLDIYGRSGSARWVRSCGQFDAAGMQPGIVGDLIIPARAAGPAGGAITTGRIAYLEPAAHGNGSSQLIRRRPPCDF